MAAFENITDITGFKSDEKFYIDKYDSKNYDKIEKTMDEILNKKDNDVIKEYITKYIPEEEQNLKYNFKCSTNSIIKLNDKFIASQSAAAAPPPDSDDNEFKAIAIEKTLFNSIKNYSSIVEERNRQLKRRYIILQEKILKNQIRRNLEKQQQSMFAFLNRMTYLGVISGVSIFCVKLVLISNLTNPAVWIGFLSKIYANPLYFQYFIDIVSSLNIFTMTETLTLKDKFSKLQLLMKQIPLFQNKKYVDALVKCIFNPTPGCLQNIESNKDFEGHDKNPQLMQFFTYIKSVTDAKEVFKKTGAPSEKKPIWEKNLLNELFKFYTSPAGYNALTSLKLATDAYGYFSQSAEFFAKNKDANPALLFKGIAVNSVNSYSFNVYSRIFTQKILNNIIGSQDGTFILDIPIFGKQDVNSIFVTTLDSFLNIQTKSIVTGYFTKLEQEVGYDPEKEKKEKENEKKNSIEGIREDIIKRGTLVKKYERYGYSNQQIAKIISKPTRPNNYRFFLARYMKDFYNTFLDVLDDPLVTVEIFTNVSFVFNIIQNNFYTILMGGGLTYLPQMVLTGFAHKSFLNLGSLTGNLIQYEIVPIKILTAYFRFKYGSDIVINRQFELLKYSLVNDIFSDIQTLFNEMQSLFFDTSLGMSVNRYLEKLNDTIIGKLFNISCKICYLFVNFAVLPTVKNKIITFIPSVKFPIIETLENREKSERLFTFIDNKMSNIVKLSQNKMNEGMEFKDIFEVIKQDFGEFVNISKIIEGTIIPYINAEGFFEWSGKMKSPLEGAVIKFVEKSEDDKLTAYAGDILSEEKQEKQEKPSHVKSVKIVLGTDDSGYGNFKVVDTKDIKDLLVKVYDDDSKYDPRNKREDQTILGEAAKFAKTIFGENYETYKAKILAKGWGFEDADIKILYEDGITIKELEDVMKEEDVTFEKVMASILVTDSLRYKTGTTGGVLDFFLGDTGNLAKDFSMSNIYYYYYYKIFINEKLASTKAEFDKKQREKIAKQEAEIQKLDVGSKIMYKNKPAIIEQINSDGTFNIKGNDGKVIENVNKGSITPQVGSLRTQSKEEENKKDEEEFKEIIERDEKKLSKQDDYDAFAAFLQEKFNAIELLKREGKPYSVYEHGIISDMLTSLKTRESIVTHNYLWDNKGDVVKSVFFADTGIDYLKGFFDKLYSGSYDNPINPDIKLKTEILKKTELVHRQDDNAYFGINLQHSYGFSPQVVDAKKFLNSIEMLIALNSSNENIVSISNMITDLEQRATQNVNIQQSLDELNDIYTKPIADISSYYDGYVEYFKSIFCNPAKGGCSKSNMIFFRHTGFNYSGFYDKIKDIFGETGILTSLKKMVNNSYIQNFLKNNAEIKYTCNLDGKIMFLNKNFIDMNTGNLMTGCKDKVTEIDFKNEEIVLQILLRPETIFSLSKIRDLPGEAYSELKKSSVGGIINNALSNKGKLDEYDDFFKLFKGLGEDGIKPTTDTKNISIFSVISDTINEQEKEFDSKTKDGMDPIELYKLRMLFNFNKILLSQTKGVLDPQIKQSYINYFTQKEDILDNTEFLNNNQSSLEKLFNEFQTACNKGEGYQEILENIKKNYFNKDVIGAINLGGKILHISDINFQDANSQALNAKLEEYVNFESKGEENFDNIRKNLSQILDSKYQGKICNAGEQERMTKYILKRAEWYNKQSELFKLYVMHNSNSIFSSLATNYDKFTTDIDNVINDYTTNLNIIWNRYRPTDDIESGPPVLTEMASDIKREEQLQQINAQVGQQKIFDAERKKEAELTAQGLASTTTEDLKTGTKTEETVDTGLESKTEESLDLNLQYGTSANPNHFGNMLDSLIKVSPSTIYTDAFKPVTQVDVNLKDKVEEKEEFSNPAAQCARYSNNWNVKYDEASGEYSSVVSGDFTSEQLNSYGCQQTNLMYNLALGVNKLIINLGNVMIGILTSIEAAIKFSPLAWLYPYVSVFLWAAKAYSSCFIYIFHTVMLKKFSDKDKDKDKDMIKKLTNGEANLGEKLVFGLWIQMVNTLKESEGGKARNTNFLCNSVNMSTIGVQDINNIETNAYTLINEIGEKRVLNNTGDSNISPSLNNLPGYIDAGLIDRENNVNYSNIASVAPDIIANFLSNEELASYDKLMEKPNVMCKDLEKFNSLTALKLSIWSLVRNPNKSFFYKNLNCRLFGSEKADFNDKHPISTWNIIQLLFSPSTWKNLIEDFMTIMFTNEGLKPYFLTKLFGNKSQGNKLNFVRDLIDDSFDKAKTKYFNNISVDDKRTYEERKSAYENYVKKSVSNSIYTVVLDIITSFFRMLFDLKEIEDKTWVGIGNDNKLYTNFRKCKSGLCDFKQIEKVTRDIINAVQDQATIKGGLKFDTTSFTPIDLESETSKNIISAIVNSKSYDELIENLTTNDKSIFGDIEISNKWKIAIYQQYKEVLTFYKDYSEYNTAIVKHLNEQFKDMNGNVGFKYRVANYNYRNEGYTNKIDVSYLNNFLIKPCPEGQILYFYNKEGVVSFNCIEFTDIDSETFEENKKINEKKFDSEYKGFEDVALKNNGIILDLFANIEKVICDNPEYCGPSTEYNDFVNKKNEEFSNLLNSKDTTPEKIVTFQKDFLSELKNKIPGLLALYGKQAKDILNDISELDNLIKKQQDLLKEETLDENARFIIQQQIEQYKEDNKVNKEELIYFQSRISIIEQSLNPNIDAASTIGSISTPEMIAQDFIIAELKKDTISPDYFAYLYCKLFSISEDNPDILNLFEFFNSTGKDIKIQGLESKITNNKYYFTNESDAVINSKLLENEDIKKAILKNLKVFLSKNQKEQYMYTGKTDTGFYIKDKEGKRVKVEDGFDIVKGPFSETMPHDKGIEENEKDLAAIKEKEAELAAKIIETEQKRKELEAKLGIGGQAIIEARKKLEAKKQEIQDKLAEIREADNAYYERYKAHFEAQKEKENEAKEDMENKRKEYNEATEAYNELIKGYDKSYYDTKIEPYLKEKNINEAEFDKIDKWLRKYSIALYDKAVIDYDAKRTEASTRQKDLLKENADLEINLIYNKGDVNSLANDFDTWVKNLEEINALDSFLLKSKENQKFDIERLADKYYSENNDVEGLELPKGYTNAEGTLVTYKNVQDVKDNSHKLFEIKVYEPIKTRWEIIKATVKTWGQKFKRFIGYGESDEDKEKKADDLRKKADNDYKSYEKLKADYDTINSYNQRIGSALYNYVEPQVDPSKRAWYNIVNFGYNDFLNYNKIDSELADVGTHADQMPIVYKDIQFSTEMKDLRGKYENLQQELQDIQTNIKGMESKLSEEEEEILGEIDKLLKDIKIQQKVIEKRKQQLEKDIEVRKKRYKELLKSVEKSDKEQLAELNHKFGYSIKIDGKGQISLQKTSNAFKSNSVEEKLLNSFKQKEETKGFLSSITSSITSLFSSKKQTPEKNLGKDSNGNPLPLNSNKEIVDDKVKDGFPPILVASDIEAIMNVRLDVNVNIDFPSYFKGLIQLEPTNLNEFSKQKIKQYIGKHYTQVNGFYIMNTQLKFWEGAFEGFTPEGFAEALQGAMEQKIGNAKKFPVYEDYRVTEPGLGPDKTTIAPTQENIDNVFGVSFNYFDSLKIRGVDESHMEKQGSINAIRGNKNAEGKMVDGAILKILPLNIYGPNITNYDFNFINNTFELFFPGRIELTK